MRGVVCHSAKRSAAKPAPAPGTFSISRSVDKSGSPRRHGGQGLHFGLPEPEQVLIKGAEVRLTADDHQRRHVEGTMQVGVARGSPFPFPLPTGAPIALEAG